MAAAASPPSSPSTLTTENLVHGPASMPRATRASRTRNITASRDIERSLRCQDAGGASLSPQRARQRREMCQLRRVEHRRANFGRPSADRRRTTATLAGLAPSASAAISLTHDLLPSLPRELGDNSRCELLAGSTDTWLRCHDGSGGGQMGRRSFGREFKLEAVRLVRERGVSVAQAARDPNLTRTC
jgi:hypothetical protein